jgi:hypothetical protein
VRRLVLLLTPLALAFARAQAPDPFDGARTGSGVTDEGLAVSGAFGSPSALPCKG